MDSLEAAVRHLVTASGADAVSVVATSREGLVHVDIDGGEVVHAASTMKLAVLVELFRIVDAGAVALDDSIVIRNAFTSLADGSQYRLDPADDSEHALYAAEGTEVTLRDLAVCMITLSSNLATNLLVALLDASRISSTMADLGWPGVRILRGVEDGPAFAAGWNNTVTARDLAGLLGGLVRHEVVSPAASAGMLAILEAQAFNEGIPAGLPPGTRVAHKTGSISRLYHDAAIVWPAAEPPYVLVVLTRGLSEERDAPALVASIASLVHAVAGRDGVPR